MRTGLAICFLIIQQLNVPFLVRSLVEYLRQAIFIAPLREVTSDRLTRRDYSSTLQEDEMAGGGRRRESSPKTKPETHSCLILNF